MMHCSKETRAALEPQNFSLGHLQPPSHLIHGTYFFDLTQFVTLEKQPIAFPKPHFWGVLCGAMWMSEHKVRSPQHPSL